MWQEYSYAGNQTISKRISPIKTPMDGSNQALKRNKHWRLHLIKFLHNIHPTTGMLNKFDGGQRTCPLCASNQKDRDILCCSHLTRATWRSNFLRELKIYCEHFDTYLPLQQLLISVLGKWLQGKDNPTPYPSQYPRDLKRLLSNQRRIGWRHFLQGWFAVDWGALQARYHERKYPMQQFTSDR